MNKFGAIKQKFDGHNFDSTKEARRWGELKLLERAGEIRDLKRQVRIPLEGRDGPVKFIKSNRTAVYVADFVYFDTRLGAEVIEDAKGYETDVFKLKRAILAAQGREVVLS